MYSTRSMLDVAVKSFEALKSARTPDFVVVLNQVEIVVVVGKDVSVCSATTVGFEFPPTDRYGPLLPAQVPLDHPEAVPEIRPGSAPLVAGKAGELESATADV